MDTINPHETDSRFDLPLSEIRSDLIHDFHRHWLRLCRGSLLPSRSEIDPANFKRMLPNVILVDIECDPFRVRYRLCGTRVAEFCGKLTGRYLDELEGNPWSVAAYIQQYQTAVRECRPVFSHDWLEGQFGARHKVHSGIWPLAGDGRTVDMCIAVEDYLNLRRTGVASGSSDTLAMAHAGP
jgi:hypothetical protein